MNQNPYRFDPARPGLEMFEEPVRSGEPQPFTATAVYGTHVDALMTEFANGYAQAELVADQVVPVVNVAKQSNKYPIFGNEEMDVVSDARGASGAYQRVKFALSTDTYFCKEHGLEAPVDQSEINNADPLLGDPVSRATRKIMRMILLNKEIRVASLVGTAGNWTTAAALSGADRWDDPASDPRDQIMTDKDAIAQLCGFMPNRLLLGLAVYRALRKHPLFIDLFKYTGILPTLQRLQDYFEVDQIIVPKAAKNSAKPGQTRSASDIWGKIAYLCYFPTDAEMDTETPKAAAQFVWTGDTQGQRFLVERYFEDRIRAEVARVRNTQDSKVTGADFAALRTTVVS